jgi:hypothetical protein
VISDVFARQDTSFFQGRRRKKRKRKREKKTHATLFCAFLYERERKGKGRGLGGSGWILYDTVTTRKRTPMPCNARMQKPRETEKNTQEVSI